MPPRYEVDKLPDDQLKFVLDHIIDGETDREISFAFEAQFKTKLAKSSLSRWREAAGNELAERYRMARYQAKQLIEDLQEDPEVDKHGIIIASIEDRLLTATREVTAQDPFKLLIIQQEEKRRNLRERELKLKERSQAFHEEQAQKSDSLQQDRLKIGADVWRIVLAYFLKNDPQAADHLTKHNEGLLSAIEESLEAETA